jgi:shikimate kinase
LYAGGFEWHDPSESFGDNPQGVENPYKNPQLLESDGSSSTLKIDPARLLSPRLNGVNVYLIGMMGTGKSTVGRVVAKRKLYSTIQLFPTVVPWSGAPSS